MHSCLNLIGATACTVLCVVQGSVLAQNFCPAEQKQRLMPACNESTFFRAISALNDRLAVGRYNSAGGRVTTYVLDSQSGEWQFEAHIIPPGLQRSDSFGQSVELRYNPAVDGWQLAVGSQSRSTSEPYSGTAYVFTLNPQGVWELEQEILPDPVIPYGWFGTDVSWATYDGRTFLTVGAPGSESLELPGQTYIYERDGNGTWQQRHVLTSPDGPHPDGAFGRSVDAVESAGVTVLAVGEPVYNYVRHIAPGTVFFYRFEPSTDDWVVEAQFQAPDPYEQDLFGWSLSVGAANDDPNLTHRVIVGRANDGGFGLDVGPGAAFSYVRDLSGEWTLEQRIEAPYPNPNVQQFGWSVDLQKVGASTLAVGGPNDTTYGLYSGSAFVLVRDSNGLWVPSQRLYGQDVDVGDAHGWDVTLGNGESAGLAMVGASGTHCPGGSQEDSVGAVYSFDLNPGQPGNCPPPVLTLQKVPDCFSGPGGEIEVRWFQATPDQRARIALLYAKRTGNFVIPNGNPCSGTALQLGQLGLQVAHTGSAGQFGAGRIKRTVPRSVCGGYLQLVDITRCATSNVVRIE